MFDTEKFPLVGKEAKLSDCKAELNSASEPVSVLFAKSIDLFVNVSVVALPTKVSVALGNVTVLSAVGSVTARVVSKLSAVLPSNTILDEKTPADVTSYKLQVVITVPETLGKVIVLSAVGSVTVSVVSKLSAVLPSKIILPVVVVSPVMAGVVNAGLVNVLFVNVSVVVLPTSVSVVAGKVKVIFPANAECAGACNLA